MYRALLKRDPAFEGIFFAGVKTTGIFCRPTCPAKKPKPANVEYFSSTQAALLAGYRPCGRCAPMELRPAPALIKRLQSLTGRVTGSELRTMGIDPSTARRQFQRYYGMTFHAYHRARRMGLALHEVRNGEPVIAAQLDQGFESASGFSNAFRKIFGAPPSRNRHLHCLLARWIETPLGAMLALADKDGLHLLEFVDRRGLERELRNLTIVPGNNPHLDRIAEELNQYFAGTSLRFAVPVVVKGSAFERGVWELLQTIPAGQTWSYAQLAGKLGCRGASRAVGRANGRNRLALVIPCHRVIRSDGELCGYGGGVWRKRWLLDHERRVTESGCRSAASSQSSRPATRHCLA